MTVLHSDAAVKAEVERYLGFAMTDATAAGRARLSAMAAVLEISVTPTSLISYRSAGRLLIIGPAPSALSALDSLPDGLHCVVLDNEADRGRPASAPAISVAERLLGKATVTVVRAVPRQVQGYLGQFVVTVDDGDQEKNLATLLDPQQTTFDLVLDLGREPCIQAELPPPGYYAPEREPDALERALSEAPEMVGEFQKPKYFDYKPAICVHGARGVTGCTRCLDVCPALAITAIGEEVSVEAHRCHGAGICATVCPTGAITYTYPGRSDTLARIRQCLANFRSADGTPPAVLFFDAESESDEAARMMRDLPEWWLPMKLEQIGSAGMEIWLSCLAWGASQVAVLATAQTPASVVQGLEGQMGYASAILEGMDYPGSSLRLLHGCDEAGPDAELRSTEPALVASPATFGAMDGKREAVLFAIDHLHQHSPAAVESVPLPSRAPFGEVLVDTGLCTLCMSCVAVCPVSALVDGVDQPELKFIEGNCVQCGLCQTACPERAINLAPRFLYQVDRRREARMLYQEPPFYCVECGKPFATRSMIEKMEEQLADHRMFQGDARRRLRMCEDCRVRDMFVVP